MYIIEVLPIHKSKISESLSYFSSKDIKTGALVSVPFRSKKIKAIVLSSGLLSEQKSQIKKLSYNLKKIDKIKNEDFFDERLFKAVSDISIFYGTSKSMILKTIIPEKFLDDNVLKYKLDPIEIVSDFRIDTVQDLKEERFAIYKSYIREEFAKKNSVFFSMSSLREIEDAKSFLEKGIETRTFIITNEMTEKELALNLKKIKEMEGPYLVISTPQFLSVFAQVLKSVIVDSHNSKSYITLSRPFLDMRKVSEIICKNFNIKMVLGDVLLSLETIWKTKNDFYGEMSPLKYRYITTSNCQITFFDKQTSGKKVEIFTEKSKEIIRKIKEENRNLFIYTTRKGLSPNIFCADCGKNVVCGNCKAPVSLHENKNNKEDNFFICPRCRSKRSAMERCQKCDSWKLLSFGFGIESVLNEIKNITDSIVFTMDKDTVKTHKKALQISSDFYKTTGSIMLGTSMAIGYLNKPVDSSIVTSFDGLLSMPDFRINEKIMKDILSIREKTESNFIIQTRQPEFKILEYGTRANISDFYREEIKEREEFEYPPFSTFIKISLSGQKSTIRKEMEKIQEEFAEYDMFVFDGNFLNTKREHVVNGLLKVSNWPDPKLSEKLQKLPPQYTIKIDPDNIL